jgi:hypothetical protein
MTTMHAQPGTTYFREETVVPNYAELEFHFLLPPRWERVELPEDPIEGDNPDYFLPLAAYAPDEKPLFFAVGARPAFEEGSVALWLETLCHHQGFDVNEIEPCTMDDGTYAMICRASQESDLGSAAMVMALLEDGGNLYAVSAMCPLGMWPAAGATLERMVRSFSLSHRLGPTVPLIP